MSLLVGIVNLVVLLFIVEAWVNGRIAAALAKAVDERLTDPSSPASTRLDRLERRTDEVGARLDGLDRRLDDLDARLDGFDRRLTGLDTRLAGLDDRLGELDTGVGRLDARLDRVDAQVAVLNAQTSQQISDLDRRVRERLRALHSRTSTPETETGSGPAGAS
jgi:chromosome segregation ATPase